MNQNVVINGYEGYLAKCINGCANLAPLPIPGPIGNVTKIVRLDTDNIFLLSYSQNSTHLFRSNDFGSNWIPKANSAGAFSHYFAFFDTITGIMTDGPYLYKTTNGGNSWVTTNCPFTIGTTAIKTYGDSLICLGGIDVNGRGFMMSKNRGNSWIPAWGIFGHNIEITDFYFLNKDTIFGVSTSNGFYLSTDGGANWSDKELPMKDAYGVLFLNKREGYVVGNNDQNHGIIAKTTDLGLTWSTFDSGINTTLLSIAILNDSVAILTGTNGVLLRWNFKNSVFTNLNDDYINSLGVYIFPNPTKDVLHVQLDKQNNEPLKVNVFDLLGRGVLSESIMDNTFDIDISHFPNGIYILNILSDSQSQSIKIIKE